MKKKKGFTLLELLVVVLIIGILAAIALPQYQLSVDKTQFAKMQTMVNSVRKAYHHYLLIHGKGPKSFDYLHLDFPSGTEEYAPMNFFKCVTLPDMYLCMSRGGEGYSGNVRAFKKDLSFAYVEKLLTSTQLNDTFEKYCSALKGNQRANRLCKSIGSYKELSNATSTPLGEYMPYYTYDIK